MALPAERLARGPSRRMSGSMRSWLEARLLELNTCRPGIVVSYDAETKRAVVQPALDMLRDDGAGGLDRVPRARLLDVPVMHPSAGGAVMHFELVEGDGVMLLFSDRGLTAFKRTFGQAAPDTDRLMSETDAVAIPGFGAREITPAEGRAACLQREDGTTAVIVHADGTIEHRVPTGKHVHLGGDAGSELVYKAFLSVFNAHVHPTPSGPSGPPTQRALPVHHTVKTRGE